jgi:hypothetical protein
MLGRSLQVSGCFLFCTRRAYFNVGGFNEAMDW